MAMATTTGNAMVTAIAMMMAKATIIATAPATATEIGRATSTASATAMATAMASATATAMAMATASATATAMAAATAKATAMAMATVETRGYQLCQYNVVLTQLVATCLNKSVLAGLIGKCDVWKNNTQTPVLVLPHIHVQLCMVQSWGSNTVPLAGTVK